ncbi:hypothetical protein G6F22_021672 [Rhizopus arrhizus]|nr:hypothetical protein G6F22_021672 [Rhizopus arrhizus]
MASRAARAQCCTRSGHIALFPALLGTDDRVVGQAHVVQLAEPCHGARIGIHAQIGVLPVTAGRAYQQRRRPLPAALATGGLAGFQRRQQARRQCTA